MKQRNQLKSGRKKLYTFWECVEWRNGADKAHTDQEESLARPHFRFIRMPLLVFVLVTLVAVLIIELLGL